MEALRLGSSIPGSYWGCCAWDVFQNFKNPPDEKASIEVVSGDSGTGLNIPGTGQVKYNAETRKYEVGTPPIKAFLGKTWREIFEMRLRIGTHNTDDRPNRGFIAAITDGQCNDAIGKEWLAILKENGFEFVRTVYNSVTSRKVHLFILVRECGGRDTTTPPTAWTNLPEPTKTPKQIFEEGKTVFYSEEELEKDGVPVWLAGRRSKDKQELKRTREQRRAQEEALERMKTKNDAPNPTAAFPTATAA